MANFPNSNTELLGKVLNGTSVSKQPIRMILKLTLVGSFEDDHKQRLPLYLSHGTEQKDMYLAVLKLFLVCR